MSYSVNKLGLDHFLKGLLELVLPGEEGKKYTHNSMSCTKMYWSKKSTNSACSSYLVKPNVKMH